jgi:hypothetical protein
LNSKTLVKLAENVVRKITHPDEIIFRKGEVGDFWIVQRGKVGLCCRQNKSELNGRVI